LKSITKVRVKKGLGDLLAGRGTASVFITTPEQATHMMFKHDDTPRKVSVPIRLSNVRNPNEVARLIASSQSV
jgi:hypothetical protein